MNCKREFVRNDILSLDDVEECFEFAYKMTFGGQGAHRDHRSGAQGQKGSEGSGMSGIQAELEESAWKARHLLSGQKDCHLRERLLLAQMPEMQPATP